MAEKYTIHEPINDGKGHNLSEQEYKAVDNYDMREKDTDNVFLEADGTAKEVDVATITDNDYVDITKDDDGNVTSLKIK